MRAAMLAVSAAVTGGAAGQNATLAVTGLPADPVPNGTAVTAYVRLSWTLPGGIGYAGGAFRLRFNDSGRNFGIPDVVIPSEQASEHIGINGATTVWSSGRRPGTLDGNTMHMDGMFRYPPQGTGAVILVYRVYSQADNIYLTGHNTGVEGMIEHAQLPPGLMMVDSTLFVSDTSFDLFKFTVRAPLTGNGTVTITPEMLSAAVFTSPAGAVVQVTRDQWTLTPASFSYTPGPPISGLVMLVGLGAVRRRRGRRPEGATA
jgi:hypothetical protein